MSFYRNGEGYADPTAGAGLSAVAQSERQERQRLAEVRGRAGFEELCKQFKQMAKAQGLEFPGRIWLRDKKTGFIFKEK